MADTGRVTQSFLISGTLQTGTARVTQSFLIAAAALGVTCGNPPAGSAGVAYSHTFPAGSGSAPYTFAVIAGALPDGLSLNASTGVVSGTPTIGRLYAFTIQVTDAGGDTASVSCSILIVGAVAISLLGWKLYPDTPCETAVPGLEVPHVKRAV